MKVLAVLVAVALPLGLGAAAPAQATVQRPPDQSKRETSPRNAKRLKAELTLTPANGARVAKHPVRLAVRTGKRTTIEAARLNGTDIRHDLRSTQPGRFAMPASASDGLVHGRNTLRVRILAANGKMRTKTSTFRITHTRPLAGAGRDVTIQTGSTLRLKGTVVRHPQAKGTPIRRSWTLVRGPKTMPLTALRPAGKGTARLTANVPGTYRLKLTTTQGGKSTSDVVEANVVDSPMAVIDTMATGNSQVGIKVGRSFYAAPQIENSQRIAQILVLDRQSLQVVSNKTYGYCYQDHLCLVTDGEPGDKTTTIPALMSSYSPDNLVVVSVQPGFNAALATDLPSQLSGIGAPKAASLSGTSGEFSIIGIPGLRAGEATYRFVRGGSGRIDGFLVKNRWDDFQYVDPRSSTFSTRTARGCGSTGLCGVTVEVGGQQYTSNFGNAAGGYVVDVFDGHELTHSDHDAFRTNSADAASEVNRMIGFLEQHAGPGDLVMVNSVVQPGATSIGKQATGDSAKRLAEAVAAVGGTKHRFNTSASSADTTYTLLGWEGAGEGAGQEDFAANPVMQGRLNPDNALLFKPAVGSESMTPNETLQKVLLTTPGTQAWPEADNPALAWIGNRTTPRLGSNPRTAYWTQTYDWAAVASSIDRLSWDCPPGVNDPARCVTATDNPGFSQDQFDRAQDQLGKEVQWVSNVRNYMANFAAPYEKSATKVWEDTQTTAYTKLRAEPDPLQANPLDVVYALVDFFAPFTDGSLEVLLDVAATAVDFGAMHLDAKEDGSSPDEELQVQADQLATKMRDQADNTAASFDVMGDVLVSDYAKLSTLGPVAECNGGGGGSSDCPPEFQWNDDAIKATSAATQRAAMRQIYSELTGVQFPVWTIARSKYSDSADWYCNIVVTNWPPFAGVQRQARIAALQEIYPDGSTPSQYDTFTIASVYSRTSVTNLDDDVLKQLFAPAPSTLQARPTDGLGLYPQDYARDSRSNDWPDHAFLCAWDPGSIG